MKCDQCPVKEFVHADLYCQNCPDRLRPKMVTGDAYLYRRNSFKPIDSAEVTAPAGLEYEMSAVELMSGFRIEFIPCDSKELTETILRELNR